MYAFVVLLRLSRQTAFEPLCQKQFPSRPNNLWRNPPPNIRYLYVSYDQIDVIPPWKAFQRDADASGAGSAQEPVEWEQRGQACSRSYEVCGFKKGIQDNWILSPFINVSEAESISIYLEFTMSACDPLFKGQCQVIFDMYTYQTSNQNLSQSFVNETTFKQDRISALISDGKTVNKETRYLEVTSGGLYLAFRDTGSCMKLQLIEVKYYVCPDVVTKLARFPQTQSVHPDTKIISGQCVENARSTGTPQQGCKPYGQWNEMVNSACECLPGYEVYKNKECRACLPGFYKDLQGNMNCSACPDKSSSKVNGSLVCLCNTGYDRATEDPSSVACTTFPSEPLNVTAIPINATAVHVSWSPPQFNGGRSESDLSYRITIKGIDNVVVITNKTETTVSRLPSFANIQVIVSSVNGISQKRGVFLNTSSALVKTPEAEPGGPPEDVSVTVRGNSVEMTWKPPSTPNGIITKYTIRYFVNGSGVNQTWDVIHVNNSDWQSSQMTISKADQYLYQVRAATKAGYGSYSSPVSPQVMPAGNDNTTMIIIIIAVVVGIALIVIVVLVVLFCRKRKQTTNFNAPFEKDLKKLKNRNYRDPTTYSSVDEAVQDNTEVIAPGQVKLEKNIGEGEFGEVFVGFISSEQKGKKAKNKKRKVAIKSLKAGASEKNRNDFLTEASIMGQFDHVNVLRLVGVVLEGPRILILSEFMENGSLDHYLQEHDDKLELKVQLQMALDVSRGMDYLARLGYIHRDLATRNVLVNEALTCKVADFGLSREAVDDNAYDVKTGGKIPIKWTAPEAVEYRKFTSASDVWSFGVLLWEVMSYAEHPYWDWTNHKVLEMVRKGYRLPCPMGCPVDVYDVMRSCWEKDRTTRPKFSDISSRLEGLKNTAKRPVVPSSVNEWLSDLKMERYGNAFEEAGYVNMSACTQLDEDGLAKLGVAIAGHRNKLMKSLEGYKHSVSSYS